MAALPSAAEPAEVVARRAPEAPPRPEDCCRFADLRRAETLDLEEEELFPLLSPRAS